MLDDLNVRVLEVGDSQASRVLRVALTLTGAPMAVSVLLRVSSRTRLVSISAGWLRPAQILVHSLLIALWIGRIHAASHRSLCDCLIPRII